MSRQTLYKWKDQRLGREAPASMTHHRDLPQTASRAQREYELEVLRREVQRLQLERDLLKKASELQKKDLGINQQLLTNREKTLLVDALRQVHALPELLARLGLARSSYFYHRVQLQAGDKYVQLRQAITDLFETNYRCYGYTPLASAFQPQTRYYSFGLSASTASLVAIVECLLLLKSAGLLMTASGRKQA